MHSYYTDILRNYFHQGVGSYLGLVGGRAIIETLNACNKFKHH